MAVPRELSDLGRVPPVYDVIATPTLIQGNHLNRAWRAFAAREGDADTGDAFVIKYLPSETALATEFACGLAAQALRLPVPSPALVRCKRTYLPELTNAPSSADTVICYGSYMQYPYPANTSSDSRVAELIWNRVCSHETGPAGAAWDELVANGDRHHENFLFDGKVWWLFDHEKALPPLSQLYKEYADSLFRQMMVETSASRNHFAEQLLERRVAEEAIQERSQKLLTDRKRLIYLASKLREWKFDDRKLQDTIDLSSVILGVIELRLPALGLLVSQRCSREPRTLIWGTSE